MFCVCVYIFINEEFDLDLFLKLIKVSLKDKVGVRCTTKNWVRGC